MGTIFKVSDLAVKTGVDNLPRIVRDNKSVTLAYAFDEKGWERGKMPPWEAEYVSEAADKFALGYKKHGEGVYAIFQTDPKDRDTVTLTGFRSTLDTGRDTWLSATFQITSGTIEFKREGFFFNIDRLNIQMAQNKHDAEVTSEERAMNRTIRAIRTGPTDPVCFGIQKYARLMSMREDTAAGQPIYRDMQRPFARLADSLENAATAPDFAAAAILYRETVQLLQDRRQAAVSADLARFFAKNAPTPQEIQLIQARVPLQASLQGCEARLGSIGHEIGLIVKASTPSMLKEVAKGHAGPIGTICSMTNMHYLISRIRLADSLDLQIRRRRINAGTPQPGQQS